MMLKFEDGLRRVSKSDVEACWLADRHYSRQKPGAKQFMPPGETIVLRSAEGDVVFGWLRQQKRDDGQLGYNCAIFRNESSALSSEIILGAERFAVSEWGPSRGFTYVDPANVGRGRAYFNPGYCFKCAGWKFVGISPKGLHLLEKPVLGAAAE